MSEISKEKVDVVIPYHTKDKDIIELCLAGCTKNISGLGKIYIITSDTRLKLDNNVEIIDENTLFRDGLSKKYIEYRLNKEHPELITRAGWFFQQFIKMGCSYAIPHLTEYYLVVDSDVVFLKRIKFLENGQMLLTQTKEYSQFHFNCCEKLLQEPVNREHIFVAHHMIMCKRITLELLKSIELRFGRKWCDAVLDCIGSESIFSEYETCGHYLENQCPRKCVLRRLRNIQRFKMRYLPYIFFNKADYATFHNYMKPQNDPRTNELKYKLCLNLVRHKLQKQKSRYKP